MKLMLTRVSSGSPSLAPVTGEIIVETERMKDFFNVKPAGVTDGADPEPPTPTEYQQLMADIQGIRNGVEVAEIAAINANEAAEKADISAKNADETATGVAEATERANTAAMSADASAEAADDAVTNILQRVENGEFNGTPFRFSYQVGSVAELDDASVKMIP